MTIKAELADGRVLEFPDGTSREVIQATVKKVISGEVGPAASGQSSVEGQEGAEASPGSDTADTASLLAEQAGLLSNQALDEAERLQLLQSEDMLAGQRAIEEQPDMLSIITSMINDNGPGRTAEDVVAFDAVQDVDAFNKSRQVVSAETIKPDIGFLDLTLSAGGGLAGGAVGSFLGPVGTIGGTAAGAGMGQALADFIQGDPFSTGDVLASAAMAAAFPAVGKAAKPAGRLAKEFAPDVMGGILGGAAGGSVLPGFGVLPGAKIGGRFAANQFGRGAGFLNRSRGAIKGAAKAAKTAGP